MTNLRFVFFLVLVLTMTSVGQELEKVESRPERGFFWPYLYYVPESAKRPFTFLVLPNNSRELSDVLSVQEEAAVRRTKWMVKSFGDDLGLVLLRPIFPRTVKESYCYTHALDRDTLLTRRKEVERLDLQLLSMVDDLERRLEGPCRDKFFIAGFSAPAMFANRFTLLHPEKILGAAIGSPGGWPIAPVPTFAEEPLRYPIGVSDFRDVSGREFDRKAFSRVPLFMFLGDQDTNDSVPFTDGYDPQDAELVNRLFGSTPVERWGLSKKLYQSVGSQAEFRLYPGVEHTISEEIEMDMKDFFSRLLGL